jgi:flagellar biogenesis protein FliO
MRMIFFSASCLIAAPAIAQLTNSAAAPLTAPSLPDTSLSVVRVFGALALVIGIFLGGVWLFRNWQRLAVRRGNIPKLNLLETRSLGGRQTIHVIGYQQERFLIAASPTGINLLSHLPAADENEPAVAETNSLAPSFAQALSQVIKRK